MTIHKSKGEEFDAVVIVEGYRGGALLKEDRREGPKSGRGPRFARCLLGASQADTNFHPSSPYYDAWMAATRAIHDEHTLIAEPA